MKIYGLSFKKNEVYQANLIKTDKSPIEIELWYKENEPTTKILGIHVATADDMKPGKPLRTI